MKRLVIVLLLLTPWALQSMEPEEKTVELKEETVTHGRPSWLKLVEEVLPGEFSPSSRISQVLAQEILRRKPQLREFILDKIPLSFTDFLGHTKRIFRVRFNPAGDRIVTLSYLDDGAMIWDSKTGKLILHLPAQSVNFNSAGDKVVIIDMQEVARICDAATGKLLQSLQGPEGNSKSTAAVFNPAGDKVVTDCPNGTAQIWDVETGTPLHSLKHTEDWTPVFNRAGDKVLTGSCLDDTVMKWDVETGRLLYTRKNSELVTAEENFDQTSCEFSSAGHKVTFSESSDLVMIWDVETDTLLHTLEGHGGGVSEVLFNPAGDKLVTIPEKESYFRSDTGIWERDTVRLWNVKTGELLHSFRYHFSWNSAVFSPAGDKIAVGHEDVAGVWDLGLFLEILEFLTEITPRKEVSSRSITHRQVALLLDIYDIIERSQSSKASGEGASAQEGDTFDFNNYPELIWDEYKALPEVIRRVFEPYVIKPSTP